jgi:photosystem II stability/assembly factor-like uncharacterized protein
MVRTYAVGRNNSAVRLDNHTGPWVDLITQGTVDSIWRDVMSDPSNPDKVVIVGTALDSTLVNVSIQVSFDAGLTWTIPTGTWSNDTSILHEVWYVNTNIIWAVGENGIVVKSIDGGLSFNTVPTAPGLIVAGDIQFTAAIHALDNQVAVVLGSPTSSVTQSSLYVWKTIDGGTTWTMLSGASLPPPEPTTFNDIGNANGIWMSPNQQKIVVGSGYNQYLSLDGGLTWTDQLESFERSGVHLTWFPTYAPNPQYFRHVGGAPFEVNESIDSGLTYQTIRAYSFPIIIPPTNTPIQILGAHFYTAYDGYYSYHEGKINYIDSTNNGGASGIISHSNIVPSASYEAIWTSGSTGVTYQLVDCAGIQEDIFTNYNLSGFVGQIITIADDNNKPLDGCWEIFTVTYFPIEIDIIIDIYSCFETCVDCLPIPLTPCPIVPRSVYPNYTTGNCDPDIVEAAFCKNGENKYKQVQKKRFDIKDCCPEDEDKLYMNYEKIKLLLLTSTNPTPDPCSDEPIINEYYLARPDGAISFVLTYVDSLGITRIITIPSCVSNCSPIRFCAERGTIFFDSILTYASNESCDANVICVTNQNLVFVRPCILN